MGSKPTVHLGYEVGSGEPIAVPVFHSAVTGQTQQSGKTTTLEAMITRSGCRAITFITKRGEGAFSVAHQIPPYFVEETGWQFVQSVLESTMGQKLGMHRAFIIKAAQGTRSLADVKRNVDEKLEKARGFAESIYTELSAFLDIVMPQVETLQNASKPPKLLSGLNVMDLSAFTPEMQGLIIRSMIAHVFEHEQQTITVIPEAWEFIPQGRSSPVALVAERLIRKGATLGNYIWLDSQDIAGVSKVMLRGAGVWLLGVQREQNEIARTLKSIPAGIAKPSATELATLDVGQFYACWKKHVVKVYVQPAWLDDKTAQRVARGEASVADVHPPRQSRKVASPRGARNKKRPRVNETPPSVNKKPAARTKRATKAKDSSTPMKPKESTPMPTVELDDALARKLASLPATIEQLTRQVASGAGAAAATADHAAGNGHVDEDALFDRIKARLLADADLVEIADSRPAMRIKVDRPTIEVDGSTPKGRIGLLIARGFFDDGKISAKVRAEMERTGPGTNNATVAAALKEYLKLGFLTVEGRIYTTAPGAVDRIVEVEA